MNSQQFTNQFLIEVQGLESEKRQIERQLQQELIRHTATKELLNKEQQEKDALAKELENLRSESTKLKSDFVLQEKQMKQVKDALKVSQGGIITYQEQARKCDEDLRTVRNSNAASLKELTDQIRELHAAYKRSELVKAVDTKSKIIKSLKNEVNELRSRLGLPAVVIEDKDLVIREPENTSNVSNETTVLRQQLATLQAEYEELHSKAKSEYQKLYDEYNANMEYYRDMEQKFKATTEELSYLQQTLERQSAELNEYKQNGGIRSDNEQHEQVEEAKSVEQAPAEPVQQVVEQQQAVEEMEVVEEQVEEIIVEQPAEEEVIEEVVEEVVEEVQE